MPQMLQVLRQREIGMLTAGISTRADAHESNVHFSTISHLQRSFREFDIASNRPDNFPILMLCSALLQFVLLKALYK